MTQTVTKTPEVIYNEAVQAGIQAGTNAKPTPMIVGTPTSFLGSDIDFTKQTYFVEGGVCGFAWVNISPARGKFVAFLKAQGIGRTNSYEGGYDISVREFGQSLERKEAYARAFADVLRENGIKAYACSRMD